MGQTTSVPHEHSRNNNGDTALCSRFRRNLQSNRGTTPGSQRFAQNDTLSSSAATSPDPSSSHRTPSTRSFATFTRQVSASSIPAVRGELPSPASANQRDAIFYEGQEERPLVHMEDLGMRNAPITHITASPMPRRSRLSRLSSLMLPGNTGAEHYRAHQEGQMRWPRLLSRYPSEIARDGPREGIQRLSFYGGVSPDTSIDTSWSGSREFAPTSQPDFSHDESATQPSSLPYSSREDLAQRYITSESSRTRRSTSVSFPPLPRLTRIHRSIVSSLEVLPFARRQRFREYATQTPPERPTQESSPAGGYIPQPLTDAVLPSVSTSALSDGDYNVGQETRRIGLHNLLDPLGIDNSPARVTGSTDRQARRPPLGQRGSRRMSGMLASRSTRLIRRDHDEPLPHILNLAALAMAVGLARSNSYTGDSVQEVGPDDLDGNLYGLFRPLQPTMLRTAAASTTMDNADGPLRPVGLFNPLSYLRVFRYVRDASDTARQTESLTPDRFDASDQATAQRTSADGDPEVPEGRIVMLVVIGIRPVPPEDVVHETMPLIEPDSDSLRETRPTASAAESSGTRGSTTFANGRPRGAHRPRASSGEIVPSIADRDYRRQQSTMSTRSTDSTSISGSSNLLDLPSLPVSISPPGPRPPPSTPAETGLSAYSSRVATPSPRQSSASFVQQAPASNQDAVMSQSRAAARPFAGDENRPTFRPQQRRRSDSEFPRRRDLGAGATRRNGVVAPDDVDTSNPATPASRSWLIYIIGTSVAEDHPALTTPSLFTDVSFPQVFIPGVDKIEKKRTNMYVCRALLTKTCYYCRRFLDRLDRLLQVQKMLRSLEAFSVSVVVLNPSQPKAHKTMACSSSDFMSAA